MEKSKPKMKNWIYSNKAYSLLLVFLIISFSTYIIYRYDVLSKYTNEVEYIKTQIAEATKENKELQLQSEYKNSLEYIEKLARDKLGMLKNNEIIFYDTKK